MTEPTQEWPTSLTPSKPHFGNFLPRGKDIMNHETGSMATEPRWKVDLDIGGAIIIRIQVSLTCLQLLFHASKILDFGNYDD